MRTQQTLLIYGMMVAIVSLHQRAIGQEYPSIKIGVSQDHVLYGDPMVLNVTMTFGTPQVSQLVPEAQKTIRMQDLSLLVRQVSTSDVSDVTFSLPWASFIMQTEGGLEYAASITIWYEQYRGTNKWRMIFNAPGTYELTVAQDRTHPSNPLRIVVEESALGEKGLALLENPEDFIFLASGMKSTPQTTAHLESLVEQCGETLLGQMAAARLGIECARQLEEKYPAGEEFLKQYQRERIEEPLVLAAQRYLSTARGLPDSVGVRESVLYKFASVEIVAGNYTTALSLLDELATKYPQGEYGGRAGSAKTEVETLMKRESLTSATESSSMPVEKHRPLQFGIVAAIAVAVLIVASSVTFSLVSKKRRSERNTHE